MRPAVTGVCPVIAAAFHPDGSLDLPGFTRLCEHVLATGVRSVMVFGVATENAKLTDPEREAMLAALLGVRGGRPVTVVASVADHATELAVARARRWAAVGADVLNILPSRFLDPPLPEALAHLRAVLTAVDLPMIIQFLPQAGDGLPLGEIVDLAEDHPTLVSVKVEQVPAAAAVRFVHERSGGRLTALVGWGGLEWGEAVDAGAVGVQPGCSLTELYLDAQEALDRGDRAGFAAQLAPLREPLAGWLRHVEVLIAAEKDILRRRGILGSDYCRRPGAQLTAADRAAAAHLSALADAAAVGAGVAVRAGVALRAGA